MSDADNSEAHATKTCVYCIGKIHIEATKCRFCGSSQNTSSLKEEEDDRHVVYIVDRDVVLWAKFAVAILAIFTVFGLYLYGVDVKNFRDDLAKETTKIEAAKKSFELQRGLVDKSLVKFKKTEKDMNETAKRINRVARQAAATLAAIKATEKESKKIITYLSKKVDGSFTIQETIVTSRVNVTSKSSRGNFWPNGAVLRVKFIGGSVADRNKVEKWAHQWSQFANIKFDFSDVDDAEVRISFVRGGGAWSSVGTQALDVPFEKVTMNLGWMSEGTVLHQFGHVLGMQHEHQNPFHPIPWNKERLINQMARPPNNWTIENTNKNIIEKFPIDSYPIEKSLDVNSVMMYPFSNEMTVGDFVIPGGQVLSDGDKAFIAKLYPK